MRLVTASLLATLLAAPASPPDADPRGALPAPAPAPKDAVWPGAPAQAARLADAVAEAARAGSPWTLARLHRLANFTNLHAAPEALARAVDAVLGSPRVRPLTKDHALFLRAQARLRAGDVEGAGALLDRIGVMRVGRWIGAFDNAAGGGHRAAYGPEGPRAAPETWGSLEGLAPRGRIELSELAYPEGDGVAYVAVVARADAETKAALRIGASDAVKAWVGGRVVVDRDVRRFAALDQESAGVVLAPGANPILVKVSWSGDAGALWLRLTAPEGGPLEGVRLEASAASLREAWDAYPTTPEPGRTFEVETVQSRLDGGPARRLPLAERLALRADLVAVLGLYDRRKRPTEPERLLEQALRAAPEQPRLRFYYAHRVRGHDPSRARAQLEAALASDPGYAPARLALAQTARAGGRLLDAREHLEAGLALDPDFAAMHAARARLGFEMLDEEAIALARLKAAVDARPALASQPDLRVRLAQMHRSLSNAAAAREDAERTLELDATDPLARALAAELALEAGDLAAARAHLEATVAFEPYALGPRLHLARVLSGTAPGPQAARAVLEEARAVFGGHPRLHTLTAELELIAGRPEAAVEALEAALAADPHQPEVRRRLRALAGGADRLELRYAVEPRALMSTPVSEAERRWGATYLLEQTVVRLFDNGKSARFRQAILRMNNPRLEDALRGHRIPYAPSRESVQIIAAERIKRSGEVVPAAQVRDEGPRGKVSGMYIDQRYKLIVFDALEAGDVVHLQYRIDTVGENIFGGFFGDLVMVQDVLPKREFRYRAIAPPSRPLYGAAIGMPAPERSEDEAGVHLAWRAEDLPGIEVEPLAPPYPELGRMLSVSTYDSWDALGEWYARLFSEQMELDDAAREAGRRAVAGATDDTEKVERLYDYVVKNTRYVGIELGIHGWKPFPASEVHRRRYGDCKDKATLLAALLEDNGVPATITLVRTADRGRLPDDHATMWAFDHAITYVPGLDLFLDPTAEFNGSTELPHQDQGAMALVVFPDGRARRVTLPLSRPEDNLNASEYVATLAPDTSLVLEGTERFAGARAAELRRELEAPDDRLRHLEEPLAQTMPGAKVVSAEFSDLSDLEAPVHYSYRFEVPRYGRRDGERLSFPVALYRHQLAAAYAPLAERAHAVYLAHPWQTTNRIRYRLPPGAKISSLPESVTIDSPHVSLVQTVRRTEDGFESEETVTLKHRVVPAEDYPRFREACLAIDRAMARTVVLEW